MCLRMVDVSFAPKSEVGCTKLRAVQPELQSYQEGCPSPYTAGVLTALLTYLAVFSPGLGAVPWAVNSELFTPRVTPRLAFRMLSVRHACLHMGYTLIIMLLAIVSFERCLGLAVSCRQMTIAATSGTHIHVLVTCSAPSAIQ